MHMCTSLIIFILILMSYLAEFHTVPVLWLQMALAMKIIYKEIRGVAVLGCK